MTTRSHTAQPPSASTAVAYRTKEVDGIDLFYREAGTRGQPALLLLHGFPSSSHMFRDLIPLVADEFHLIAPDLPGFGFTEVAAGRGYRYSFDNLARTMKAFVDAIGLERFALYVFDYGAPVGWRVAMQQPERITALVSQNGNAYVEGLGEDWNPIQAYWQAPTQENRNALRALLTPETTKWQYTHGVADPQAVAPEGHALDALLMTRPGNADIQLDLFLDYASNVALYPSFQSYFRQYQPALLAVWGENDPFFLPAGAEAFRRDLPKAEIHLLKTGHFALETHANEVAQLMRPFLRRHALQAAAV
jgi:pimeloyl-ACP methyl ester carboxylesterase